MKLEHVEIRGFGRLTESKYELKAGLNVFFGPNESGKSTLQDLLVALLYGFYEGDRARREENEWRERLIPWSGGPYAASLEYCLDNGVRYRVERNFETLDQPTTLINLTENREETEAFGQGRHGNVGFARQQLGMTRSIFQSSAFIAQGEINQLESGGRIAEAIMSVAEMGRPDASTSRAQELLERTIREQVGTERARSRPLPIARRELAETRRELTQSNLARDAAQESVELIDGLEEEIEGIRGELPNLNYIIEARKLRETEEQHNQLADIDCDLAAVEKRLTNLRDYEDFPADRLNELAKLQGQHDDRGTRLSAAKQQADDEATAREECLDELLAVSDKLTAVESLAEFPSQLQRRVQDVLRRLDSARTAEAVSPIVGEAQTIAQEIRKSTEFRRGASGLRNLLVTTKSDGLKRLRQGFNKAVEDRDRERDSMHAKQQALASLGYDSKEYSRASTLAEHLTEDEYGRLREDQQSISQLEADESRLIAEGAPIDAAETVKTGLWSRLYLMLGSIVRVLAGLIPSVRRSRRRRTNQRNELLYVQRELSSRRRRQSDGLAEFGLSSLDEADRLERVHARMAGQVGGLEAAKELISRAESNLQDADGSLREAIYPLGITASTSPQLDLIELSLRLLSEVDTEADRLQDRQRDLKNQKQWFDATLEEVDRLRGEVARSERSIRRILDESRIVSDVPLDKAIDAFRAACDQKEAYDKGEAERQQLESARRRLLRRRSPAQLEKAVEEQRRKVQSILANHPQLEGAEADEPTQELEERRDRLDARREEAAKEVARLRAQLEERLDTHRAPAEIEEALDTHQQEVTSLESFRNSLNIARDALREATEEHRRDFGPRLSTMVADQIATITDRRYEAVYIAPDTLNIRVKVPETGDLKTVEALSYGTQDLCYLLLRIAIAQLMSQTHETIPLIMDDPLVNLDHERVSRMLSTLLTLSTETQIILLTKSEEIREWCEREISGSDLHSLQRMALHE